MKKKRISAAGASAFCFIVLVLSFFLLKSYHHFWWYWSSQIVITIWLIIFSQRVGESEGRGRMLGPGQLKVGGIYELIQAFSEGAEGGGIYCLMRYELENTYRFFLCPKPPQAKPGNKYIVIRTDGRVQLKLIS